MSERTKSSSRSGKKTKPYSTPATEVPSTGKPGYIVCIGASAGGLDALERFFKACPSDTGAAFVVIQHLSPDHKSMMANLLARHTEMPIILVENDMELQPNRLHLIPPGTVMHVSTSGHLQLTPKVTRTLTLPIDIFFSSMSEAFGSKAVGIILSGTGTDGTRGAEAINACDGFLMAQDPESSKFDGMPRSIIATGFVDAVLPVEDLPERLVAHIRNLPDPEKPPRIVPHAQMASAEVLTNILQLLHQVGGIDFADYKPATVLRRIERRMQIRHTPEMYRYLDLLENEHAEVLNLRREMLISVTSFFRDPEAFQALSEHVISPLVKSLPPDGVIRVWTAGVATGEEAYSLAMLFIEVFERHRRWPNLKIFATDVDQTSIESAGAGQYSESAAAELPPERLERFFIKKGDTFVVRNEVRQCIVFARHNLLTDPPFTRMDLVVCRNTLIYFKTGPQERALRSLQYAVCEGGALMLGASESLSSVADGMQPIDAKLKLFRRTGPTSMPLLERKSSIVAAAETRIARGRASRAGAGSFADIGLALLMQQYVPPSIIVNDHHEIVHLFGDLGGLLRPRQGSASLELNRQLPEALVPVASALVYKAERERIHLRSDPVSVIMDSKDVRQYRLVSWPLELDGGERMTLLSFEFVQSIPCDSVAIDVDAETAARVDLLERELMATRESLQATIEELETSNEELQATNEELMASNEELQSSNEELQSLNEEMGTVNAEFQEKMLIVNRANADLEGMAQAAGVPSIFVDDKMCITRFSPDAMQVFNLRSSDVGRQLNDLTHCLNHENLIEDIAATLSSGRLHEFEVRSRDGRRVYLARILPYIVPSTTLRGAVLTFIDITPYHDARKLQAIVDALPEHIVVLDRSGVIAIVNAAWKRFAKANDDPDMCHSGVGVNYLEVCSACNGDDSATAEAAVRGIRQVLEGSETRFSLEYPCHSPTEERWFVMNVAPVSMDELGVVVSHVNVTALKRARQ